MTTSDVTIRIRAIDEATPVIRRIRRELWWSPGRQFALFVGMVFGLVAIVAAAALSGLIQRVWPR